MKTINNIQVDLEALASIDYECRPELCRNVKSCCARYEVCLGAREIARITGMMPHVVNYAPHLQDGEDYDNPFEQVERNLFAIDEDEDECCTFAYKNTEGCTLCSIHSAALDIGVDWEKVKPKACVLWPLSLSEDRPPILYVQENAFDFPCNKKRSKAAKNLAPHIVHTVRALFGAKFLDQVLKALR